MFRKYLLAVISALVGTTLASVLFFVTAFVLTLASRESAGHAYFVFSAMVFACAVYSTKLELDRVKAGISLTETLGFKKKDK